LYCRRFDYVRAESFADACESLRRHGDGAKLLAGGQSLLPMVNAGLVAPEVLVDISRIPEARGVALDGGFLMIGALNTHHNLATNELMWSTQPLLAAAAGFIGSGRIRNRGTLGGSLAHSDPAAELPLVMTALNATYEVTNGQATRRVKAEEFATSFMTTQLEPDEIVTSVRVPILGPEWGWSFTEVSRRRGDFAIVAAAALVRSAGGVVVEARLALGHVADHPRRFVGVEAELSGARHDEIAARVGTIEGIRPVSDTNASGDYRRRLASVLATRALEEAFRRSEGNQ
jgi:aerobic carbon-monoxide dehydrogenase medium subunit